MATKNHKVETGCWCGSQFNDFQKSIIHVKVCRDLPAKYFDEEGHAFCVYHYPSADKGDDFSRALLRKLDSEDHSYHGVWFPIDLDLSDASFDKRAEFFWCVFNGDVSFIKAEFNIGCDFRLSHFKGRVSFELAEFGIRADSDEPISFHETIFSGVADFNRTVFYEEAEFSKVRFESGKSKFSRDSLAPYAIQSNFSEADFRKRVSFDSAAFGVELADQLYDSFDFSQAVFEGSARFDNSSFWLLTSFVGAKFKDNANFRNTFVENSLSFNEANFQTFARFSGDQSSFRSWKKGAFSFQDVEIEKPDRIFFQSVQLQPDAFMNTDIRKFDFTDIKWNVKDFRLDWSRFKDVLWWEETAQRRRGEYKKLEKVYRRFAAFAEENNDYQSASTFRFTAFDIQRITPWYGRLPVTLLWWYKWTSGYGENWKWCAAILLTLIFLAFPYVYMNHLFRTCANDRPIAASLAVCESGLENVRQNCSCIVERLQFSDAVIQSLTTATLQNSEYRRPITVRGEVWLLLEKIFVPFQAALLALAIRRRFMR